MVRDSDRAGEIDVTVTNRSEPHVCVWVDLVGCLYARLKIESDSRLPTIPQLSRWLSQCVCLCVCFSVCMWNCDRQIRTNIFFCVCCLHSSWFHPAGSDTAVVGIFQRENYHKWSFMISTRFAELSESLLLDFFSCLSEQKLPVWANVWVFVYVE